MVTYIQDARIREPLQQTCLKEFISLQWIATTTIEAFQKAIQSHPCSIVITTHTDLESIDSDKVDYLENTKVILLCFENSSNYAMLAKHFHYPFDHLIMASYGTQLYLKEVLHSLKHTLRVTHQPQSIRDYMINTHNYHHAWLASSYDISLLSQRIHHTMNTCGIRRFQRQRLLSMTYELLSNAIYDAPHSAQLTDYPCIDKAQPLHLKPSHWPQCEWGADGKVFAIGVKDPFGTLNYDILRDHLSKVLHRHAPSHVMEYKEQGGAGLGFFKLFLCADALIVEVSKQRFSHIIALIDISQPSQAPKQEKMFHYIHHKS
ncbi:MAG: hypothetical protein OXC44_07630 [Proteobacteria bacterium]|nr:hypothetical protein [Pseudomonadota bacterium]